MFYFLSIVGKVLMLGVFIFPVWVLIDARKWHNRGANNNPKTIGAIYFINPVLVPAFAVIGVVCWESCRVFPFSLVQYGNWLIFALLFVEIITYSLMRKRWVASLKGSQ